MKAQTAIPLLISIVVIILIAILERYSKTIAAITATMPLTVTFGLWIVYTSSAGEVEQVSEFTRSLLISIVPSLVFLVVVFLTSRAGWKLLPMLLSGYTAWAFGLAFLFGLRTLLGL
jgi:hypothetical protein